MPRKPSSYYPHDLGKRLELLVEGFEKHDQELTDSSIPKDKLKEYRENFITASYKVTDVRTELKETIEMRDKVALQIYREVKKTVSYLKYKYGAENLTLLDFGINPSRERSRKRNGSTTTAEEVVVATHEV